jgi:hypothetical protein
MVQTESLTAEGYGEMCRLLTGEETVADNAVKSICCLKTSCTADESQTSAGVTKSTESGLTIADATVSSEKTTETDDTIQAYHTHTAGESATVKGAGLWCDADDHLIAIVCYASDVAMESSDTLKNTFKIQLKAD